MVPAAVVAWLAAPVSERAPATVAELVVAADTAAGDDTVAVAVAEAVVDAVTAPKSDRAPVTVAAAVVAAETAPDTAPDDVHRYGLTMIRCRGIGGPSSVIVVPEPSIRPFPEKSRRPSVLADSSG